jgi:hypothetical protein
MKRSAGLVIALVFGLSLCGASVFAKDLLEAGTLKAGSITSETKAGKFTILATSDKGVNVDAVSPEKKAKDGSVFKTRIKLNGAGDATMRSVSFSVAKKSKITVYLNSGSKTEERTLLIANKSGDIAGEITAPADEDGVAGVGTAEISAKGDYFVYSKKSGINIYKIVIE